MASGAERDRLLDRLASRGISDAVLAAMEAVPRPAFVPAPHRDRAWADRPLPIDNGQTISAPHMVAMMADELDLSQGESVLEIGTGCGYHAAVTATLVGASNVVSVEVDPELASAARQRLAETGYEGVTVVTRDGHEGHPERAPYDAAYLTCAAPEFPSAVVDQVRVGGRLLGPLGDRRQTLVFARKTEQGLERSEHGGVRFVPMRESEF
ncbi:MAG: protein-L-isoaspartate(D-aspartate) O-methyltransferase [Halobacteriaceae archaeon]